MAWDDYKTTGAPDIDRAKEERVKALMQNAVVDTPEERLAAYERAATVRAWRVALARATNRRKVESAKLDAAVDLAKLEYDNASKEESRTLSNILQKEGLAVGVDPDAVFDMPGTFRPNDSRRGPGRLGRIRREG